MSVVDDPSVVGRKVLRMDCHEDDVGTDSTLPRVQLTPPENLYEQDEFWCGVGIRLPSSFPVLPADRPDAAVILSEIYGPPANGPAPMRFGVYGSGDVFHMHRKDAVTGSVVWSAPVVRDQWFDVVWRVKLSANPAIGYYELWLNTGAGFVQQTLNGSLRLYMATLDSTNSGGPNAMHIKNYRVDDLDISNPVTVFFANHRVGKSLAAVDPGSHV